MPLTESKTKSLDEKKLQDLLDHIGPVTEKLSDVMERGDSKFHQIFGHITGVNACRLDYGGSGAVEKAGDGDDTYCGCSMGQAFLEIVTTASLTNLAYEEIKKADRGDKIVEPALRAMFPDLEKPVKRGFRACCDPAFRSHSVSVMVMIAHRNDVHKIPTKETVKWLREQGL